MNLTDIGYVKRLMASHGITFQKKFGQNFLINPTVPQRIAEECGAAPEDAILEIGPGIGTMTQYLCEMYAKVVAVEIDHALIGVLKETLADYDNVTVIEGDIMKTDLQALFAEHFAGMRVTVCANLPYYITTPILMLLLDLGKIPGDIPILFRHQQGPLLQHEIIPDQPGGILGNLFGHAHSADGKEADGCYRPQRNQANGQEGKKGFQLGPLENLCIEILAGMDLNEAVLEPITHSTVEA